MPNPFGSNRQWDAYSREVLFECFGGEDEARLEEGAFGMWGCGCSKVHVSTLRSLYERRLIARERRDKAKLTPRGKKALEGLR